MKFSFPVTALALILFSLNLPAQTDSVWQEKPELSISGFLDVFYVYDFNQPQGAERQPFFFNHNRHNEFNLNLGLLKFGLKQTKYRANLALQTGTYANDNYAAEPGLLKNINEANIGISLNARNNLWLDAGVLPAHIGFESAISMDNMTLTRSIVAENSPYFLTGAKVTYNPDDKWEFAALIVNGWQRIQRLEGNSIPSFGTQVNYKPTEEITLNWSTFIGTDDPDIERRMRYFNNFYGIFKLTKKIKLITGFDIGFQQVLSRSSTFDLWFVPTVIAQYSIKNRWKAAFRAEYYQDNTGIIIPLSEFGFRTSGLSFNLDYAPTEAVVCRFESRWLNNRDSFFESRRGPTNNNFVVAASIAVKFSEMQGDKQE